MIDRMIGSTGPVADAAAATAAVAPGDCAGSDFYGCWCRFFMACPKKKKKQKFISRFVFAALRFLFVFSDLFAFVAVRWRRGIFPWSPHSCFHYPSSLLLHAHWENICGKHAKCGAVACVLMQR